MPKEVIWTPNDTDKLVELYENHTQKFIFDEMEKHGKGKNAVSARIKELKGLGIISKSVRLSLEDRLENDREISSANELNLDKVAFRKRQRKFYHAKALELLGI